MPKNTRNDGAHRALKEEEKTSVGEMIQSDTEKEDKEETSPSDTPKKEQDVVLEERKETDAGTNDESDVEGNPEEEEQYAGKSPTMLLEDGKRFFREKKWLQAAEYFSRALESKVRELDSVDFHPELGTYYLWFGDALLIKEEQQAELFRFNQQQQGEQQAAAAGTAPPDSDPSTNTSNTSGAVPAGEEVAGEAAAETVTAERRGGNVAGKVSDEELAFEILEMARKCLAMKLEDAVSREKTAATEEKQIEPQQQEKEEGAEKGEGAAAKAEMKEKKQQEEAQQQEDVEEEMKEKEQQTAAVPEDGAVSGEDNQQEKQQHGNQQEEMTVDETATTERRTPRTAEEKERLAEEIRETVMDLSFAHVRLADMQLMNEKYEEAAQDYGSAVQLRDNYRLPKQTIVAPLLCLAQATYFSGRKQEALSLFQRTYSLACQIQRGELAMPEGMTQATLNDTLEDLQLQIMDLQKQIETETAATNDGVEAVAVKKGSQSEAKDCIAKTTTCFDPPQLASSTSAPVKFFKISPPTASDTNTSVAGPTGTASTGADAADPLAAATSDAEPHKNSGATASPVKKRRIDLRTLQTTQAQVEEE